MEIKGKVKDNMKEGQETLINTAIESYCIPASPKSDYINILKNANKGKVMKNYKPKICKRCGEEFMPVSGSQKYCEECIPIAKKERNKQYGKQHNKQYCLEHAEHRKQRSKQHYLEHKEQAKQWYKEHRLIRLEQSKQWRKDNHDRRLEIVKKSKNKRKRNLGFEPLNEPQKGYVAHHINKKQIVYIPKELHQNIYHNQSTDQGMDEMNTLAVQYWISQVMKQGHKCSSI